MWRIWRGASASTRAHKNQLQQQSEVTQFHFNIMKITTIKWELQNHLKYLSVFFLSWRKTITSAEMLRSLIFSKEVFAKFLRESNLTVPTKMSQGQQISTPMDSTHSANFTQLHTHIYINVSTDICFQCSNVKMHSEQLSLPFSSTIYSSSFIF